MFLDGETYEPKFMAIRHPQRQRLSLARHRPGADAVRGRLQARHLEPEERHTSIIKDFGSGYEDCKFGPWEGSPTPDGNMVVISCNQGGFAYDIKTDKKYPNVDLPYDNVRICPLGTYMIWGQDPDTVTVTDLEGTEICIIPDDYISATSTPPSTMPATR